MAKKTRYEVAKALVGGEMQDWKYEQQRKDLIDILDSLHRDRPLMNVNDMLRKLLNMQERP